MAFELLDRAAHRMNTELRRSLLELGTHRIGKCCHQCVQPEKLLRFRSRSSLPIPAAAALALALPFSKLMEPVEGIRKLDIAGALDPSFLTGTAQYSTAEGSVSGDRLDARQRALLWQIHQGEQRFPPPEQQNRVACLDYDYLVETLSLFAATRLDPRQRSHCAEEYRY